MSTNCRRLAIAFTVLFLSTRFALGQKTAVPTNSNAAAAVVESVPLAIPASDEGLPGAGPIRRYDWFQNLWLERRTHWAARRAAEQGAVVFLGDSITQGWGDDFGNMFPEIKTANRGISGDTTRGMLVRLEDDVLSLRPAGIVLLMGTNDLEEGAEPATIADNLKLIIARLKQYSEQMPIVLCQVFPSSESKRRPVDKIKQLNQLYRAAVKGDRQVTVLDTWTLFADAQGDAKESEFPDLLHPNAAGYAKWGAALRPIFATVGFCDTGDDSFEVEPEFEALFNGKDLTGWGYRPTSDADKEAARRWQASDPNAAEWPIISAAASFDGMPVSNDGRYVARHGRLVVTTPPSGRSIQQLWTTRDFSGDFTLKLEFRATPNADSGVFIRGNQLQCRDFLLAGPYKELKEYRPQDWNELVIVVRGNAAECRCNGELLEAAFQVPDVGPLGLEGDRGQMEYRRIRWRKD